MPDDAVHKAELAAARAEGFAEALEQAEARDKARREKKNERQAPVNRLRRGLAATNPTTKENDR